MVRKLKLTLDENQGSLLRYVFRSGILCATAWGVHATKDQVAATQLFAEAVIQAAVRWNAKRATP